ncbi:MAG: hypothetical protein LUC26_02295 [Prevotella sp.]|nr:hypothetical protein [Prevotella sp.]
MPKRKNADEAKRHSNSKDRDDEMLLLASFFQHSTAVRIYARNENRRDSTTITAIFFEPKEKTDTHVFNIR